MCAAFLLSGCGADHSASSGMVFSDAALQVEKPNPLVLYYSRGGTTRVVAREIADMLSCDSAAILSRKHRRGLGVFTCVFDQLLDRDDILEPIKQDISGHNPIIVCTPLWIHRLSSPMRTFIKSGALQGKTVHLIVTFNGNQHAEQDSALMDWIREQGVLLASYCRVLTRDASPSDIKKLARSMNGCCTHTPDDTTIAEKSRWHYSTIL